MRRLAVGVERELELLQEVGGERGRSGRERQRLAAAHSWNQEALPRKRHSLLCTGATKQTEAAHPPSWSAPPPRRTAPAVAQTRGMRSAPRRRRCRRRQPCPHARSRRRAPRWSRAQTRLLLLLPLQPPPPPPRRRRRTRRRRRRPPPPPRAQTPAARSPPRRGRCLWARVAAGRRARLPQGAPRRRAAQRR